MKLQLKVQVHQNDVDTFDDEEDIKSFVTSALENYDIKVLEIEIIHE